MTEASVRAVQAWAVRYREPNDHDRHRFVCLVRIQDSDGATGWGEAVTLFEEATHAVRGLVQSLAPTLLGEQVAPEAIWQKLKAGAWWYGEGGMASFALAAIDTAVWDLAARRVGTSVLKMLGGASRTELPIFVTSHATLADLGEEAARFAGWAGQWRAAGVKVGFGKLGDANLGFELRRDVRFVAELRDALGPEPKICIDVGAKNRWTVADAVQRARAFSDFGLHWLEEPLGADDPVGYAELKAKCDSLIAYGEREWTARGLAKIVSTGTVDVVGIDAGRAEGITGFVKAARFTELFGREVNAHAFAGPISYAAGLACSFASVACRQFEVAPLRNELIQRLTPSLPTPSGGTVAPIAGDGLGVEIDVAAVEEMAV